MHELTFFPLGNADCYRIDLQNGRQLLFDFAATKDPDREEDRRIDLPATLKEDLAGRKRGYYDVVVFSHLDSDHVRGSSDFFQFQHAAKYQGHDRIEMREIWVPAAAIIEDGLEDEARVVRQEARYRLRNGSGIRVFSRPGLLEAWFQDNEIDLESRRHLIVDAGGLVPGFSLISDQVEFFVHSPLAVRVDESTVIDRNSDAIVLSARFVVDNRDTRVLLTADIDHAQLAVIVDVTRAKGNQDRLEWDVVDLPHHCSYLALGPEKGKERTEPIEQAVWLYEEQGRRNGILVAPSDPVSNVDTVQPPHRQAAAYYRDAVEALGGEFKVTMEHPRAEAPEPLVIRIDGYGSTVRKFVGGGVHSVISRPAPRAGFDG